jgi:hypothetical protein
MVRLNERTRGHVLVVMLALGWIIDSTQPVVATAGYAPL